MNGIRGIISWHDNQWHIVTPLMLWPHFLKSFFYLKRSQWTHFTQQNISTEPAVCTEENISLYHVAWCFDIIGFLDMIILYRCSRQKMHYEISSFLLNCVLRCNALPGFDWAFYMCKGICNNKNIILSSIIHSVSSPKKDQSYTVEHFPYSLDFYFQSTRPWGRVDS